MKICGIYKITNTVTGDFYIGSSKNVKHRWVAHKSKSTWKNNPNNPMYLDMQKYRVNSFVFQILEEVEPEQLKEMEQQFIETLNPTYNNRNANGLNVEKQKKYRKQYEKSDKRKEQKKQYNKSDKSKEQKKQYHNQLCSYNGETLTLCALASRFRRAGIEHPVIEAKKYLVL